MPDIPYSSAKSGAGAREEISKLLRRINCDKVGFMDDFEQGAVLLAFTHRGTPVQLAASAKGWASWYLRENPWTAQRKTSKADYEKRALAQGMIAVNSILRDWAKGQVAAIECGLFPAEAAFLAHIVTKSGTPLIEAIRVQGMLPAPEPRALKTKVTP